jgi:3-oxoacyl-[acyl-carrier-protein] synthase-3
MTDSPGPRITPSIGAPHARLMSVGSYQPSRVVTNEEICQYIDSSDEWIRERSGVVTRRFAAPEETVTDMAEAASRIAIERAGIAPSDIDGVIVATVTHMHVTPSSATLLAYRLGCDPAPAVDISAACAGFSYGLAMASDMVRAGSARHVLVVGSEKLTDFIDPYDRSTAFLFGDAAGAVVVGPSEEPGIGPAVWGAEGEHWDAIVTDQSWDEARGNVERPWPYLKMDGPKVFRWAVWQMSPVAQKALDVAGITGADLNAFIPHQANTRIIEAMAKQLKLPESVAISRDVSTSGNTSAASIPLAMDHMLADGSARSGGLALLIGFGAGLAYSSQVVRLP